MSEAPTETTDLAAKLRSIGVSKAYASQLVNRRRRPSLSLAEKIQAELGVPISHWSEHADRAA